MSRDPMLLSPIPSRAKRVTVALRPNWFLYELRD
jgi:hypothetical protein